MVEELYGIKNTNVTTVLTKNIFTTYVPVSASIFLEDKNSKHQGNIFKAKKQLERSNKKVVEKLNQQVDYAILCRIPMESPFIARKTFDTPFKSVFIKALGKEKQAKLEMSEALLLCV